MDSILEGSGQYCESFVSEANVDVGQKLQLGTPATQDVETIDLRPEASPKASPEDRGAAGGQGPTAELQSACGIGQSIRI